MSPVRNAVIDTTLTPPSALRAATLGNPQQINRFWIRQFCSIGQHLGTRVGGLWLYKKVAGSISAGHPLICRENVASVCDSLGL
jgi:hypothetical protein